MNEAHFYDYPLCLHAFGTSQKERIDTIMAWCWVQKGIAIITKLNGSEAIALVNKIATSNLPAGLRKTNRHHCAVALGLSAFSWTGGSIEQVLQQYYAAQSYVDYFNRHGKQVYASMKGDLLFEVREGKGISWREYSILAAIRSYIGKKRRYAWVSRSVIIARALGYKTKMVLAAELCNRKDNAKPLEVYQINYSLDRLHERLFFARVRKDKWHTYFSTRLTQNELETAIAAKSDYKADFHKRRIERDRQFFNKSASARQDANVKTTNVKKSAEAVPASLHVVSTPVFTEVFTSYIPSHVHPNIKTESTSLRALSVEAETDKSVGELGTGSEPVPEHRPPKLEDVEEALTGLVQRSKKHAADWFREKGSDPAWTKQNWKNHILKWLSRQDEVKWI